MICHSNLVIMSNFQGLLFEFKEDNNYKIGMSNSPYQKDQMTKIGEVAKSFCFKQSQRGVIN